MLDHLSIMAANGFEFDVDQSAPAGAPAGVIALLQLLARLLPDPCAGRRLRLKTVPMSKSVTFGADDVYELISLLTARPGVMCAAIRVTNSCLPGLPG